MAGYRPIARNVVWRGFETGVGSGEGAVPPPQKNFFGIFSFEMVHFDAFWRTFRSTVIVTVMFMTIAEV